jgi:hypothetical protein
MLNLTDISHNQKENKIINLKKICYNNKKLKFMPIIKDLKHVEILFLNDNEISTLSFCQDLPNLKELYMQNNNINDLKEIEYLSFCKKLHTIYLKGNPIQIKNNQIYVQKIKKVVISIKNIDGTKIFQDKKLNLYYFLKNSSKKKQLKRFNNDLLLKNIKPSIITDNTNSTATNNIRIYKRKASGYKDYNSVDHTDNINHHMKLKKYNNGKKLWNYVNFNDTIKKDIERTERRRKSDFGTIRRMIDKCNENTCVNNLNVISNEDNKEEITNSNVLSSVNVLLNGLNLVQLKQLQNYVNKKLSITKLNIYNE